MSKAYDLDPAAVKVIEAKAQRRADLRQQFLKLKSNPFIHATGEGGAVFDPAMLRYQALQVSGVDHFKANRKTGFYGLVFFCLPLAGYFYAMYSTKWNQEAKLRRGEVAYKDRNFKFI
ncbi:uncharacterized protein LOC114328828 [Diabrotica virgifera virgifera]|uniref:NADH dehydrogenase [ubiquinone] 1 beta subcomplex subunit 4 n=1 Tax=Diabrotica virgifera virgifera TaxID=50390 RepID=A0A6P7FFB4_DIAVI|nr:uncharacterized protein LOC114328828 [Diabrotica virgifera virgifera]